MNFDSGLASLGSRPAMCALLVAAALLHCSSSTGNHEGSADAASDAGGGTDAGSGMKPHPDSGTSHKEAGAPVKDAATERQPAPESGVKDSGMDTAIVAIDGGNVCNAASGAVAWTGTIAATSPHLALVDLVVAPNNDVIVADLATSTTYEQHRWSETGAVLSAHQDSVGAYTGSFFPSPLFAASDNGLFYGMLMSGKVSGSNSEVSLVFTKLLPSGTPVFQTPTTAMMPTSSGPALVTMFDSGGDSGGGLHGPLVMSGPQYFDPGVYCWGSTGADEGPSAQTVTAMLTGHSFEWPTPDSSLAVATPVTADINLGCGNVTVPAAGGILLASAGGGSGCNWNKLLDLPTSAVTDYDFRLGADTSTVFAVVYSGTVNFGGGALTSAGTSSIAVARFDHLGNLLWAKSFGGAGSKFTLGDVHVSSAGILMLSAGYSGTVDLGDGPLSGADNSFVAVFDTTGTLKWSKTVTVSAPGELRANVGTCGVAVATNSPSVNFGTGPLSSVQSPNAASIGVAALGL